MITELSIGISEYIFFFLSVLGIFILRRRKNALPRRYRASTFNPVIFCVFSGVILLRGVVTDPVQGLALFFLTLIGWVLYSRRPSGRNNVGSTSSCSYFSLN